MLKSRAKEPFENEMTLVFFFSRSLSLQVNFWQIIIKRLTDGRRAEVKSIKLIFVTLHSSLWFRFSFFLSRYESLYNVYIINIVNTIQVCIMHMNTFIIRSFHCRSDFFLLWSLKQFPFMTKFSLSFKTLSSHRKILHCERKDFHVLSLDIRMHIFF